MRLLRLLLTAGLIAAPSTGAAQVIVDSAHARTIIIKAVTAPPPPVDTPLVHEIPPGAPLLAELTRKARRVASDTVWIYSNMEAPNWPYAGKALDSTFEALFAPFYPTLSFPHDEPQLFAAMRFVLDPQHIGYLLRVPGLDGPTALDLWVYDARTKRFALPQRLAEFGGDEGCGEMLESILIRSATDGQLQLLVHRNTGCSDIETGKVLSNTDSLWVRPWTGTAFAHQRASADSALPALFRRQRAQRSR